jgi:tetratricopeptide (TPR) repeat protein
MTASRSARGVKALHELARWVSLGLTLADLNWARFSNDQDQVAEDLLELGKLSLEVAHTDAAEKHYGRAKSIALEGPYDAIVTKASIGLMYVCIQRLDYARAMEELEPQVSQVRRLMDKRLVADALRWFGICNEKLGRVEMATEMYQESLAVATANGNDLLRAWALGNLGGSAYNSRDLDAARKNWLEALTIFRKRKNLDGVALTTFWLGVLASRQRRYEEGRRLLEESAEAYQRLGAADLASRSRVLLARSLPGPAGTVRRRGSKRRS